ncbi:MAG: GTP cyclohydrolase I, partial [Polyangiales bacterium]
MDRAAAAAAIEAFLRAIDARGPELVGTGERVASLWIDELLDGYRTDVASLFAETIPTREGAPLVSVERIATHLVCPHHLTIGTGHASVFYLPSDRVIGLGAIGSLVDAFTHQLVLQEDAGERIAKAIVAHLRARGAACVLTFRHGCLEHHAIKRRGTRVRTVSM